MKYVPLLSENIHFKTLEEVKQLCVDPFIEATRRDIIWANFINFVDILKSFKIPFKLWLDGSFVTNKPDPSDIDLTFIATEHDINSIMVERMEDFFKIFSTDYYSINYLCHIEYCSVENTANLESLEEFYKSEHKYASRKGFICISFGLY